jgi:hypothetical protein
MKSTQKHPKGLRQALALEPLLAARSASWQDSAH